MGLCSMYVDGYNLVYTGCIIANRNIYVFLQYVYNVWLIGSMEATAIIITIVISLTFSLPQGSNSTTHHLYLQSE